MTERQKDPAITSDQQPERALSTADMAAAADQRRQSQTSELKRMQEDSVPVEAIPAHTRSADMAAAADQRRQSQTSELKRMQEDPVPVEAIPAHTRGAEQPVQLLATDELQTLRSRWDSIQTGFVDEPRRAVEQADSLVAEMMQRLAQLFADERGKLESQWSRGDNVSTEDLRLALQRYRSFFDRLLSI